MNELAPTTGSPLRGVKVDAGLSESKTVMGLTSVKFGGEPDASRTGPCQGGVEDAVYMRFLLQATCFGPDDAD